MLFGLFLTLGVAVLSIALRSFQNSYSQRAGALGILVASFLAIYFITGNWVLGLVAAVSWLFLPWLEILTRIRALRLPKEKQLRPKTPPSYDTFPALSEITREIEDEGFVHVGDAGWDWEDYRQFFRLFYKDEDRAQAAICLNEQHDLSFYYLRISSRAKDGTAWTTDMELSTLLRLKAHPPIPHQPPASRSLILAALSKSPRFSSSKRCKRRHDRCARRRADSNGNGERPARPNFA